MIGNAVPVNLAYEIAVAIKQVLQDKKRPNKLCKSENNKSIDYSRKHHYFESALFVSEKGQKYGSKSKTKTKTKVKTKIQKKK